MISTHQRIKHFFCKLFPIKLEKFDCVIFVKIYTTQMNFGEQVFNNKYLYALIECYANDWDGDMLCLNNSKQSLSCMIHDKRLKFSKKALDYAIHINDLELARLLCDFRSEGYTKSGQCFDSSPLVTVENHKILNYFFKKKIELLTYHTKRCINDLQITQRNKFCQLKDIEEILTDQAWLAYGSMSSMIEFPIYFSPINTSSVEHTITNEGIDKITEIVNKSKEKCMNLINLMEKKYKKYKPYVLMKNGKIKCRKDMIGWQKLFYVLVYLHGTHYGLVRKGEYATCGGRYPHINGFTSHNFAFFDIPSFFSEKSK